MTAPQNKYYCNPSGEDKGNTVTRSSDSSNTEPNKKQTESKKKTNSNLAVLFQGINP